MSFISPPATIGAASTAELFLMESFRTDHQDDACFHPDLERACSLASFSYYTQSHRAQEAQRLKSNALALLRKGSWLEKPSALVTLLDAKLTLASANRHKARLRLTLNHEAVLARLSPQTRCALQDEDIARHYGFSPALPQRIRPWQRFAAVATSVAMMNAPLAAYGLMSLEAVHLRVCEKNNTNCHDVIMTKTQFEQATRQHTLPEVWQFVANCQFGWQPPSSSSGQQQQPLGKPQRDTPTSPASACCMNMAKTLRPRDEGGIATGACCS